MASHANTPQVSFTTFAFARGKSSAKQTTIAKQRSVSDARLVFSVDSRRGRAQASSITSGIPGETASDSYRVVKLTFPMPRGEWDGIEGVAVVVGAGDLLGDWDPLLGAELHKVIRSDLSPFLRLQSGISKSSCDAPTASTCGPQVQILFSHHLIVSTFQTGRKTVMTLRLTHQCQP